MDSDLRLACDNTIRIAAESVADSKIDSSAHPNPQKSQHIHNLDNFPGGGASFWSSSSPGGGGLSSSPGGGRGASFWSLGLLVGDLLF